MQKPASLDTFKSQQIKGKSAAFKNLRILLFYLPESSKRLRALAIHQVHHMEVWRVDPPQLFWFLEAPPEN